MAFILRAFLALLSAAGHPAGHDGFQVAQRDGVVVFSRGVGDRFWLVERRGRRDALLLVAPSEAPFDVELAVVPGRGLVVAFSRCRARGTIAEGLERYSCRLGMVLLSRDRVDGPDGVYGLDLARYGVAASFEQVDGDLAERTLVVKRPGHAARIAAVGWTGIERTRAAPTHPSSSPRTTGSTARSASTRRRRCAPSRSRATRPCPATT